MAIAQFRSLLNDPTKTPIDEAKQLYDWLIALIAADLADANAETILYAPDTQRFQMRQPWSGTIGNLSLFRGRWMTMTGLRFPANSSIPGLTDVAMWPHE